MVHWSLPVPVHMGWDAKCLISKETWGFLCPNLSPIIIFQDYPYAREEQRGVTRGQDGHV